MKLQLGSGAVAAVVARLHHDRQQRAVHPPRKGGVWRRVNLVKGLVLSGSAAMARTCDAAPPFLPFDGSSP